MDVALTLPDPLTLGEFLAWDAPEDARWQLVDGMPCAMAPASPTHAAMQSEIGALIRNHLAEQRPSCVVLANPGVIPERRRERNYRIPDLAVTCSPVPQDQPALQDPVLIIEILSPSNQVETWLNVWAYTTIPSLREVLVVRSTARGALLLRRNADGSWPDTPTTTEAGDLTLELIGFTAPLESLLSWHLAGA